MRQINKVSNRIIALLVCVMMLLSMLPVSIFTALAADVTSLSTNVDKQTYYVGQEHEFTYTTNVSAEDSSKLVVGAFKLLNDQSIDVISTAIEKLWYWDTTGEQWTEFPAGYFQFGPPSGFEFNDGYTSKFKVKFKQSGKYKVVAEMLEVNNGNAVLASVEKDIVVAATASELQSDITTKEFEINATTEFTYTTVPNDLLNTMVLGTFTLKDSSNNDAQADVKLEYWNVNTNTWDEFYGDFGPASTGFPLVNATSKFKATFNKTGTYTVEAAMKKFDGGEILCTNSATIKVEDTTLPVISEITGVPTDWTNKDVTLTVVASDNSNVVSQYKVNNEEWQSSPQFVISENGDYEFKVKDASGNTSFETITIDKIDKTAPNASVQLAPDALNPDGSWTKDEITVTINATENESGIDKYYVDGNPQTENTFKLTDSNEHNVKVVDKAGNESAVVTFSAKYDATAPVINDITGNPTEWTKDDATLTVSATDTGCNGIQYKLDEGEWQSSNAFVVTESKDYTIYVKDLLGNTASEVISVTKIDKSKPTISDYAVTTENWTNENVTVSGKFADNSGDTITAYYKVGTGSWQSLTLDGENKFAIIVSDECNTTYSVKAVDKAGNEFVSTEKTVKIDKTKADLAVNAVPTEWKSSQISITGTVSDSASGIKSAVYDNGKGDSGVLNIVGVDFAFDTNVTESGEYTYKITVIDNAGNEKIINTNVIKIDLVNPVTSVEQANTWTNKEVGVVVTATDANAGINKVYYKKNGGTPVEVGIIEGFYKFIIPNTANDNAQYEIYSVDNAGRQSTSVYYTSMIDVTKPQKPTITYTKALKYKFIDMVTFGLYKTPVTVTISSSDDLSGLREIKYYLDDKEYSATPNASGMITFDIDPDNQYKVSAVAYDNAGNDSSKESAGSDGTNSIVGVVVDATPPSVDTAVADITTWTDGKVVISGTVSDNLSGVEKVYYTKGESTTPIEITDFDGVNYKFTIEPQSYKGKYYIYCEDYSTNVSEKKDVEVKMDNTIPTVDSQKADITTWTNNSIKVTGKVSDDLSGFAKVYWRQGADITENDDVKLNDDGTYEFTISARNYEGLIYIGCYDVTGNKADEKYLEVKMDSTKPVVNEAVASTSNWTNQQVTITGSVADITVNNAVSEVVAVKYSYDTVTNGTATYNTDGTFSFPVPATNYDGDVTVWCVDDAGNESNPAKVRVRMDIKKPQVDSGKAESADWTSQNVIVSGIVSDDTVNGAVSKVKTVKYKYNDSEELTASFDGSKYTIEIERQNYKGNVTVWCIDNAGNVSDVKNIAVKMDITNPGSVEIKYTESLASKFINMITFGFYSVEKPLTVTVNATDNLALDKIKYTVSGVKGKFDPTDASFGDTVTVTPTATNDAGDVVAGYITFNVPAEFKGKIEAVAYDCAGNSTEQTTNDKNYDEVIVDSIAPDIDVTYEAVDKDNTKVHFVDENNADVENFNNAYQALFNGKVNATITIKENNFFEGEQEENGVVHKVGILVTRTDNNGVETTIEYLPVGADKLYDADKTVEFTWTTEGNVHQYTIPYDKDADYVVTVEYVDFSGNKADISSNDGNTGKASYTSKIVTVDTIAPEVTVVYDNKDVKATYDARQYFIADQFATITVEEHNFRADEFKAVVNAKYSDGKTDVAVADFAAMLSDDSQWTKNGNIYTIKLNFTVDANYTFDYTYEDLAQNPAKEYVADEFTVDKKAPENLTVTYDGDVKTTILDKVLNVLTFGYYDAKVKVIITADDDISCIDHFVYSYIKGTGVSNVNASLENVVIKSDKIAQNGKTFTAEFEIPKDVLQNTNQFNGTVEFYAVERSTHSTDHKETATIIVDNIAPTATITYNEPIQKVNDISYYAGNIDAKIVINEANFNSDEVVVKVNDAAVDVKWSDDSVDVHTGTFTLTADGDYVVTVNYTDRSKNEMIPYTSNQLTIDTKDPVINVYDVKHQSANNHETISFTVSVTDTNIALDSFKPTLTALIKKDNGSNSYSYETISIPLGTASTTVNNNGETVHSYTVKNLEVDGYYSLVCTAVDYANHSVTKINSADNAGGTASVDTMNFSVNRDGSVFWIETEHNDKYTGETFKDKLNGAYANDTVTIKLHEVNVDKVDENADKKTVFTLNDGSESEDIVLTEENYEKNVSVGTGGWYKNVYTLNNDNFDHDGVYSLNIITYDAATNSNVNTKTEAGTISFTLDRTKPVITANVKTEQRINDTEFPVEFKITETNLNAETISVTLKDRNGKTIETTVEELGNNEYKFVVNDGLNYSFEITAKDLAGNESEILKVERFTVSTNILVLWYANTPLFWGSIAGTIILAGAIIFFIFYKKKKKEQN